MQDDKLYIFLEFMEMSLSKFLRSMVLDEDSALYVLHETCQGLAYLHSKNLLHRDIKPGNILVDANGRIKISDFGFSAGFGNSHQRYTQCGTMEYLAPEIMDEQEQTEKVDIWCLGVLFFEILHKRLPFEGKNMKILMDNIKLKAITFRPDLSAQAREIIIRCLQADPHRRPSAADILAYSCLNKYKTGYIPQVFNSGPSANPPTQMPNAKQNVRFMNANVPLQDPQDSRSNMLTQSQVLYYANNSRRESKNMPENFNVQFKVGSFGVPNYQVIRASSEETRQTRMRPSSIPVINKSNLQMSQVNLDSRMNNSGINPLAVDLGQLMPRNNHKNVTLTEVGSVQKMPSNRMLNTAYTPRGQSPQSKQGLNQSLVVNTNSLEQSSYWQNTSFVRTDGLDKERRTLTPTPISHSRPSNLTESYYRVVNVDNERPKSPISPYQGQFNQPSTPQRPVKVSSNQTTLYLGQIEQSRPFQDRISNPNKKEYNMTMTPVHRSGPVEPIRLSNLTPSREGIRSQQNSISHTQLNQSLLASNHQAIYPILGNGGTHTLSPMANPPAKVKSKGAISGHVYVQKGRSITPDVIFMRNR
jgi:serine/threonine protein kinase